MDSYSLSFKQWFFAFTALIIVVFVAWGESLNGYFIADDVWHVPLVHRALHGEPELIWRQFLAPYSFHECLYRMYRPLTDITFALDCFLWKGNAWGYHLTNVIWHAISTCLVFLLSRSLLRYVLLRDIPREEYSPMVLWKIPLVVSLLFAVYPGHAEPICWALPRIDSIGAAFTFGALICSLEYFNDKDRRWMVGATVSMIFGLMVKEMCAAIPLVVMALYLIAAPPSDYKRDSVLLGFLRRIKGGLVLCWPMFAVLAVYIVVRGIALGSLIGGYQGTIGASLNGSFLTRLFSVDAYWKLLHPINESVLGPDCSADLVIRVIYFLIAVLVVLNQKTPCARSRLRAAGKYLFLLLILVLPCLQIWGVSNGLIGARLAYTLSVPFILTVVVLIYPITSEKSRMVSVLRRCTTGLLWAAFVLFFVISMQYARAWRDATNEMNLIRSQIAEHAAYLQDGKKLVVVGLPTGVSGYCAFYTTDFLPGLLMPPLSKTDCNSRIICIDGTPTNDRVVNISLLKDLTEHGDKYQFILWKEYEKKFVTIAFPSLETQRPFEEPKITPLGQFDCYQNVRNGLDFFDNKQSGGDIESYLLSVSEPIAPLDFDLLELKISLGKKGQTTKILAPPAQPLPVAKPSDDLLSPDRHAYARIAPRYFEPLSDSEFATEFEPDPQTLMTMPTNNYLSEMARSPALNTRDGSEFMTPISGDDVEMPDSRNQVNDLTRGQYGFLSWVGQADADGNNALPIHFPVFFDEGIQTYRIHLTQYKAWLFSGSSTAFRIDLPAAGGLKLESALFKASTDYIPALVFNGQGELNSSGLIEIKNDKLPMSYDVSKIPGAVAAFVEVSEPYFEFHFQPHSFRQSTRSKHVSFTKDLKKLTGRFVLPPSVVSNSAYYQIRIAATDSSGKIVGSFSDPITLSNVRLP
ncbi:MAG: hypothetical protein SGJ27_14905 [Candidatus Melainabacteria bacterium]|nr:hypothetical protein [Candidatus Melainabacteria bacterium]